MTSYRLHTSTWSFAHLAIPPSLPPLLLTLGDISRNVFSLPLYFNHSMNIHFVHNNGNPPFGKQRLQEICYHRACKLWRTSYRAWSTNRNVDIFSGEHKSQLLTGKTRFTFSVLAKEWSSGGLCWSGSSLHITPELDGAPRICNAQTWLFASLE